MLMKFITKHPYMSMLFVLMFACLIFGPAPVATWLAVHGRQVIVGAFRFVQAFVQHAF